MLIYGNTPGDILRMIMRRKYKLLTVAVLVVVAVMLVGCGTAKNGNTMTEFFKVLGTGDISAIKEKLKGAKEKEDGSWDSIDKVE